MRVEGLGFRAEGSRGPDFLLVVPACLYYSVAQIPILFIQALIWVVLQIRVPFRVLSIRVSYYVGDLKRDPNLENYLYIL